MNQPAKQPVRLDPETLPEPVCETCGCIIEEPDQDCPARDEGVCGT